MSDQKNNTWDVTEQIRAAKLMKGSSLSTMEALPALLLMNVIARLPLSSIQACKLVCKIFFSVISEKCFPKVYIEVSPYTTIVFNNNGGMHLVELAKGYFKSYTFMFPVNMPYIVGSCNGILCFSEYFRSLGSCLQVQPLRICNPVLGQCVTLPEVLNNEPFFIENIYGFGFSSPTGQYKVLKILTHRNPPHPIYKKRSKAEIFTVGMDNNERRSLGYVPCPINKKLPTDTVNGALHWIFHNEMTNSTHLYAFDIEKEQTYQIPFPANMNKGILTVSVGVLRNCLCLFDNSDTDHFSIWSMKEYGMEESWTPERILKASIPAGLDVSALNPVAALKNDGIFIMFGSGELYFYDQKIMTYSRFEIDKEERFGKYIYHAIHPLNFCSLDYIANEHSTVTKMPSPVDFMDYMWPNYLLGERTPQGAE